MEHFLSHFILNGTFGDLCSKNEISLLPHLSGFFVAMNQLVYRLPWVVVDITFFSSNSMSLYELQLFQCKDTRRYELILDILT